MYEWLEAHQLPCLFKELWGIECPGCGFQTAILLLLKGHIRAAIIVWPGIVPLVFFGMLILLRCCGWKKISTEWLRKMGTITLFILFATYLLRQLYQNFSI